MLGWQALRAADHLGIPSVAIYQTDVAGYMARYGVPALTLTAEAHVLRIHQRAGLTLAPSRASIHQLADLGVDPSRLAVWARGVDGTRFHPSKRDDALRARLAPNGELLIGYVGRLAAEKQVEDPRDDRRHPGHTARHRRRRAVTRRARAGAARRGRSSAGSTATCSRRRSRASTSSSHPGEHETFCQTIQEALVSGVPVVATGAGGPLDLVSSSRTGWLYRPGDVADLRARVADLVGDDAKRAAFAAAARPSVAHRTWEALGDELLGHYRDAVRRAAGRPATLWPWRRAATPA